MFCVASTKRELEIVLRRYKEVVEATRNSMKREDQFDEAWAQSCIGDLYARLYEPFLAEQSYRESISLFDKHGMVLNAAVISFALAMFFAEQRRLEDAEVMLRQNIAYLVKYWGVGNHYVLDAEEELKHFQLTGQVIEACRHKWCKACGVDVYGVGFDFEDIDRAER